MINFHSNIRRKREGKGIKVMTHEHVLLFV
jgi:hypothetical protein